MSQPKPKPCKITRFEVGVFVKRGKRSWQFLAYTRYFKPEWDGCNLVRVFARNGTEAKQKAIEHVKARMNLKSQLAPTDVAICGEGGRFTT